MLLKTNQETLWNKYKTFINNMETDQKFTRKYMFRQIYGIDEGTKLLRRETALDHYRRYSVLCKIIDHEKQGVYIKKNNIPQKITVTQFVKVAYAAPWKTWFVPQEERFKDSVS
jgi:hypothetical protein